MILARTEIVVPYTPQGVYTGAATFRLGEGIFVVKLNVMTRDQDAIVQVREDATADAGFPPNFADTEQLLDRGFTSLVYVTPVTGFRFRCATSGATTRITFTAYG